jgi:hypothetical protein
VTVRHHGRVPDPLSALIDLVAEGGVAVLSGAGLSTESGIPDYRGPTGAARKFAPMTYQSFTATRRPGSATGPAATSAGR